MKFAWITGMMAVLMFTDAWAAAAGNSKSGNPKAGKGTAVARAPVGKDAPLPTQSPLFKAGNPQLGREKADSERCQECHGVDGQGQGHPNGPEAKFPKLAGQVPGYLIKQLMDFRSGARKHDQMAIMARSITDEDAADIVAYFSSQPPMKSEAANDALGHKLYTEGAPERGITPCISCHGEQGKSPLKPGLVPVVGGQEWRYLEKQLLDWRSGDRRNSDGGVMNQTTKALTDAEIRSLASYLSGQ